MSDSLNKTQIDTMKVLVVDDSFPDAKNYPQYSGERFSLAGSGG